MNKEGQLLVAHVPPTKRQRMANGFRPIEEAAIPHDPCFLKLSRGVYTIGFCPDDIWLREHDMMPVDPIGFLDFPDD
jgi:hypothetical protein